MLNSRVALLAMAVMGSFAGANFAPGAVPATEIVAEAPRRRGIFRSMFHGQSCIGRKGAGITMAQQKRAARKTRNVRRHKAASRG